LKYILTSNLKGGVGKTTVANELAFALARRGYSVTLINLDPQREPIFPVTDDNGDYDFAVIDTPPTLNDSYSEWCRNADVIIMPTLPSILDWNSLERSYRLALESGTDAKIGIVINSYNKQTNNDRDFVAFLESEELPIWGYIPSSTALKTAQAKNVSIHSVSKKNPVTVAFEQLCEKVLEEINNAG